MKFNSILAFGDSHVAGCELSDTYSLADYTSGRVTIEEADSPGKELSFPKIVADRLNIPCYNYSMTGGSNQRSLRMLTKAVIEHPNSFVLFCYTSTSRSEFYYPNKSLGKDKDDFLQVGTQWDWIFKNSLNELYLKNYHFYNNLKELAFCVESICKVHSAGYLHIPLFAEEFPVVDNLFDFDGYGNYLAWCEGNKFKKLKYYHYEQKAHIELAELILERII